MDGWIMSRHSCARVLSVSCWLCRRADRWRFSNWRTHSIASDTATRRCTSARCLVWLSCRMVTGPLASEICRRTVSRCDRQQDFGATADGVDASGGPVVKQAIPREIASINGMSRGDMRPNLRIWGPLRSRMGGTCDSNRTSRQMAIPSRGRVPCPLSVVRQVFLPRVSQGCYRTATAPQQAGG